MVRTCAGRGWPRARRRCRQTPARRSRAAGHARFSERISGVASSTSPMRRVTTTRTVRGGAFMRIGRAPRGAHVRSRRAARRAGAGSRPAGCGRSRGARGETPARRNAPLLCLTPACSSRITRSRVLEPPARVRFVETVDAHEVVAPGGEVAGLHAFPALRRGACARRRRGRLSSGSQRLMSRRAHASSQSRGVQCVQRQMLRAGRAA